MAVYKYTPEELDAAFDALFDKCLSSPEPMPPDDYIIRRELGLSSSTIERYRNEGAEALSDSKLLEYYGDDKQRLEVERGKRDKKIAYAEVIKKLDEFRAYYWSRFAMSDSRNNSTYAIYRQKNLGMSDKGGDTAGQVIVQIQGVDSSKGA